MPPRPNSPMMRKRPPSIAPAAKPESIELWECSQTALEGGVGVGARFSRSDSTVRASSRSRSSTSSAEPHDEQKRLPFSSAVEQIGQLSTPTDLLGPAALLLEHLVHRHDADVLGADAQREAGNVAILGQDVG